MLSESIKACIEKAATELHTAPMQDTPIGPGFLARILKFLHLVRSAMYPKIFGGEEGVNCQGHLRRAAAELEDLLSETLNDAAACETVLCRFLEALPTVREMLDTDVRAAYEGDPAARSEEEIMLAYPAFEAISIYRLAHVLYTLGVPLIPRMMTEYAHKNTGIDIHPVLPSGGISLLSTARALLLARPAALASTSSFTRALPLAPRALSWMKTATRSRASSATRISATTL